MKSVSTVLSFAETTESFEIKNTGLRPSWDVFWKVESDILKSSAMAPDSPPTCGSGAAGAAVKLVRFITGSEWIGEWDKLGMCGMGVYKMPHGVVYEGTLNPAGLLEGVGVIRYPNGGVLEGFWHDGKLKYYQYDYTDRLKRDTALGWSYCVNPDRRFQTEVVDGLRAADTELICPELVRDKGHYVGDGLYSTATRCVTDHTTGHVLRIPAIAEEKWISENCMSDEASTVGFAPDLYENLFNALPANKADDDLTDAENEALKLIIQEGGVLDTQFKNRRNNLRNTLIQTKLDYSLRSLRAGSLFRSRPTCEFESLLSKAIEEVSYSTHESGNNLLKPYSEDLEECDDISTIKFLQEFALSLTAKNGIIGNDEDAAGSKNKCPARERLVKEHQKLGSISLADVTNSRPLPKSLSSHSMAKLYKFHQSKLSSSSICTSLTERSKK